MKVKGPVQKVLEQCGMGRSPASGKTKATVTSVTLFLTGERRSRRKRKMYSECISTYPSCVDEGCPIHPWVM